MLVEENMLDRENNYVPCEQRRFWSSWPQGVAQGTMESPLSEPCWQDPRSTGVVLQWEAAVSVEQRDPAMECRTAWDGSLPTEGAVTPVRLFTSSMSLLLINWQSKKYVSDFTDNKQTLTEKNTAIIKSYLSPNKSTEIHKNKDFITHKLEFTDLSFIHWAHFQDQVILHKLVPV